jgi:hypothetical protein
MADIINEAAYIHARAVFYPGRQVVYINEANMAIHATVVQVFVDVRDGRVRVQVSYKAPLNTTVTTEPAVECVGTIRGQ